MKLRDLKQDDPTAIIERREQLPWTLAPLRTVPGTLPTGDYSVLGLEHKICVERKSPGDLVSCCTSERERFERELQRMKAYESKIVIVEASWADMEKGAWRSAATPQSVTGSVLAWIGEGVPFFFAGDRATADKCAARFLFLAARRRWRELRTLAEGIESIPGATV
jgi:DNA excision repair protein ERCC-4